MCGLHGYVTGKNRELNADDFIKNGFVAGMLRGRDSSGIATIDCASAYSEIQKIALPGVYLVEDKYADQLMRMASSPYTITIGHTRAATHGKVNINNAHPFRITDDKGEGYEREIVGAHNGSLIGWSSRKDAKGFEVDSEWALSHIFNEGYDAFEDFNGPYCFVWWDSDNKEQLNIALNSERPMHVAFCESGGMAFASEAGMLYWLCERNKIKIKPEGLKQLEAGYHYKFNVNELDPDKVTKVALPKYKHTSAYTPSYTAPAAAEPRVSYNSHCLEVEKVLAKAAAASAVPKQQALLPAGKEPASPFVTDGEQKNAKEMGWLGTKGTFVGEKYDDTTGTLYGTITIPDAKGTYNFSADAFVRNMQSSKMREGSEFESSIIGVIDENDDIEIVCSKPRVRTPLAEHTVH